MHLQIQQVGSPVLVSATRALSREEIASSEIQQLIILMRDTMRDAQGVGLAANQVGVGVQLAVIEDTEEFIKALPPGEAELRDRRPISFHVVINPVLEPVGDEKVVFFEGCLSLDGYMALVPRFRTVRVQCFDEAGHERTIDASGWYARILQHEIDHLHGIEYIERMQPRSFMTTRNHGRFWKAKPIGAIRAVLGEGTLGTREAQSIVNR